MRKYLITTIVIMAVISSCSLFDPPVRPDAPSGIVTLPGPESISISWDPVESATSYTIYFTDDATAPNGDSTTIVDVTTTDYERLELDETKEYRYSVQAKIDRVSGDRSNPTSVVQPNPVYRLTVVFAGYPSSPVGAITLDVDYDPVGDTTSGSTVRDEVTAVTDATATAVFELEVDRQNYFGYTLYKDLDSSGSLSSGDIVWGPGGGSYSYKYYNVLRSQSWNFTITDYDTDHSSGANVY